jgi:hypothetical protein
VPSAEGRAEAMELFREVNGDPATATTPTSSNAVGVPSAEGRAEAMELFREVNGEPASPDKARIAAIAADAEGSDTAPKKTVGVPSAEGRAEAMELFREVNGGPNQTHVQEISRHVEGSEQVVKPTVEHADVTSTPHAPSAEEGKTAAGAHEAAHAKAIDPHAPTGDIERPEIGKPAEIADTKEAIDPRGTAKPDLGNQITQINQLASPQHEDAHELADAREELTRPAGEHATNALDEVKHADAIESTVHSSRRRSRTTSPSTRSTARTRRRAKARSTSTATTRSSITASRSPTRRRTSTSARTSCARS